MGNCLATRVNNHQSPASTKTLATEPSREYHINRNNKQQAIKGSGETVLPASSKGRPGGQGPVASATSNGGSSSSSSSSHGKKGTTHVHAQQQQQGADHQATGGSSKKEDEGEGSKFNTPTLKMFTLSELKSATRNFRPDTMLGEGGFGRVFKGWVDEKTLAPSRVGVGMAVAVKKSNPDSDQGLREWQAEVKFLGKFCHPNLVKLFGYCWEEDQFLLVYEYMQKGSLENHLFRNGAEPLSWEIRLKIAIGAARGLAFLHTSEKSVIYRDFKTSNILLDSEYHAKLSDFGLAKLGPINGDSHVTTRVIGTYGYAAPEYVATGHLYVKSDVYGFGVVLLELLTGLRALDPARPSAEHNLIEWAKPSLSSDKKRLRKIMDPRLEQQYPIRAATQIARLVLRCLESDPKNRPPMEEVRDILVNVSVTTKERAQPTKVKGQTHTSYNSPDNRPAHRAHGSPKKSEFRSRPKNGVRIPPPPSPSSIWS